MWNNVSCNSTYEKFLREREIKRFKNSLVRIGPLVDNSQPKKTFNLTQNTKKNMIKQEIVKKIEHTNQILLSKMIRINSSPSSLSKLKVMPRNTTTGTLNLKNRIESQNKIIFENKRILEKLQSTQSFYSAEKWENDYQHHKVIKNNHLKFFSKSEKKLQQLYDDKSNFDKLGISLNNPKEFYEARSNFYQNFNFNY
jgi:Hemingway/CFA97